MGPRPFGRGRAERFARMTAAKPLQWGRDLSVAEGSGAQGPQGPPGPASMGPRPFGRGRWFRAPTPTEQGRASMGPRPFGRGRRVIACGGRLFRVRFNGAATFRSRKACYAIQKVEREDLLQWGRDLSVAEGSSSGSNDTNFRVASMGPRPFGRGRARKNPTMARVPGFNGAATFRSRKVHDGRKVRGDEGRASMGPRPFGRGRRTAYAPPNPVNQLQWGRDLSVAEGGECGERGGVEQGLQWGRDLSVAEGPTLRRGRRGAASFNGAATFRSRKGQHA